MNAVARHPIQERLRPTVPVVLALGGNLGDREATIREAAEEVGGIPGVQLDAVSPLIESPALTLDGVDSAAPAYLNAVMKVRTILDPYSLLDAVHRIEDAHGRTREKRWGNRTLDIDIIDFDGREIADESITLPHPRAWERGFVLAPWLSIDSDAWLPGRGRVADLLAATTDTVWQYPRTEAAR